MIDMITVASAVAIDTAMRTASVKIHVEINTESIVSVIDFCQDRLCLDEFHISVIIILRCLADFSNLK